MIEVKFAVLGGAQGSGKGSASSKIQKRCPDCVLAIETGAMLREITKNNPDSEVTCLMREGQLVPDELIFKLVSQRKDELMAEIAQHKAEGTIWILLDGVPRNEVQAAKLCEYLGNQLEFAFILEVDQAVLENRTIKRRVCPKCGAIYNLEGAYAPKQPGVCDECGENLIQRKDDTKEALTKRWNIYYSETRPALQSMEEHGVQVVACENSNGEAVEEIMSHIFSNNVPT